MTWNQCKWYAGVHSSCTGVQPHWLQEGAAALVLATSKRLGYVAAAPRAAAATAEKAKAARGPKPGSDKDKRITPKSTDFSR